MFYAISEDSGDLYAFASEARQRDWHVEKPGHRSLVEVYSLARLGFKTTDAMCEHGDLAGQCELGDCWNSHTGARALLAEEHIPDAKWLGLLEYHLERLGCDEDALGPYDCLRVKVEKSMAVFTDEEEQLELPAATAYHALFVLERMAGWQETWAALDSAKGK